MELEATLEAVNTFVREELIPLEPVLLQQGFAAVLPAVEAARQKVKALGLWAPHLPAEYGGLGLGLSDFARLSEALGRTPLGHYAFNCAAPDIGNMEVLLAHGTPEQKERWLKPLAAGALRSCFAMTEPEHAGSNPVVLSTTAVKDGGDYVIDGHKWFVSSADGADFTIVMAVTDPHAPLHARASQMLVAAGTPGMRLARNIPVMGHAGEGYFSHGELVFERCRVPRAHVLGAEGAGFALAQERLGPGRIHHAMRWIGIAERAFDLMCARAATRELAPGRLLGGRQAIQHWIAECRAEIDAARLLVLAAADKIEAQGAKAARVDISLVKFHVAGVLDRVLDRALQVLGGLGLTDDTILAFLWRHERAARIYDGPDEVHKSVVARQVLKRYGVEVEV
jgi:alkylation response protein AidB-like acyl-CoA dehydrogenase